MLFTQGFANKRKSSVVRTIIYIAAVCIVVSAIYFVFAQIYVNGVSSGYMVDAESAPNSDAVMVLGALVYGNGTPSPVLQDRLDYAYEIYAAGKAKKILVSGDHGTKEYDEVNTMKQYLLNKGVDEDDIFMDHAGFDTYDSMYRAKHVFGVETLIISTQQFHIDRAVYCARQLGIDAYGFPSPDKPEYGMFMLNAREMLAKAKAVVDTDILRRSPVFGGEVIHISGSGMLTQD